MSDFEWAVVVIAILAYAVGVLALRLWATARVADRARLRSEQLTVIMDTHHAAIQTLQRTVSEMIRKGERLQ